MLKKWNINTKGTLEPTKGYIRKIRVLRESSASKQDIFLFWVL